jgi:hypothetical protein
MKYGMVICLQCHAASGGFLLPGHGIAGLLTNRQLVIHRTKVRTHLLMFVVGKSYQSFKSEETPENARDGELVRKP